MSSILNETFIVTPRVIEIYNYVQKTDSDRFYYSNF